MKIALVLLLTARLLPGADFQADLEREGAAVQTVVHGIPFADHAYDLIAIDDLLFATYTADSRTPMQAFVLGNMVYGVDRSLSYKLHQEAVAGWSDNAYANLEWAMELHRNGQHAEALKAYSAFITQNGDYAPVLGLMADCALRGGDVPGALTHWRASEKAKRGTLEKFESMVCEINQPATQERTRHEARLAASTGDPSAAKRLIALDAAWTRDWWNAGPRNELITADLPLLAKFPPVEVRFAQCLGEFILAMEAKDQIQLHGVLRTYHDPLQAIAEVGDGDWELYDLLSKFALEQEVINAKEQWAKHHESLLAAAQRLKNAAIYDTLLRYATKDTTPTYVEVAKRAWTDTGEVRFASYHLDNMNEGAAVAPTDEVLVAAVKAFPQDSDLRCIQWLANGRSLPKEELVAAILAEYRKLSSTATGLELPRPRARQLRVYFKQLGDMP